MPAHRLILQADDSIIVVGHTVWLTRESMRLRQAQTCKCQGCPLQATPVWPWKVHQYDGHHYNGHQYTQNVPVCLPAQDQFKSVGIWSETQYQSYQVRCSPARLAQQAATRVPG